MHAYVFRKSLLTAALFAVTMTLAAGCGRAGQNVPALPDEPMSEPQNPSAETPQDNGSKEAETPPASNNPAAGVGSGNSGVLAKYDHLDPNRVVPDSLLKKAVEYYDANLSKIANKNYLSVIDFSKRSTTARFYIIDMKTGKVWAVRTAHGKGSDPQHDGYAKTFSNQPGSNMSSVGIYKTAETYYGSHGLSLRLDGLSSTNSLARSRAIVIHGADYVQEKAVIQGRSWGCPAVAMDNRDEVISKLKGGSVIYAGRSSLGY